MRSYHSMHPEGKPAEGLKSTAFRAELENKSNFFYINATHYSILAVFRVLGTAPRTRFMPRLR